MIYYYVLQFLFFIAAGSLSWLSIHKNSVLGLVACYIGYIMLIHLINFFFIPSGGSCRDGVGIPYVRDDS